MKIIKSKKNYFDNSITNKIIVFLEIVVDPNVKNRAKGKNENNPVSQRLEVNIRLVLRLADIKAKPSRTGIFCQTLSVK